MNKFYGGSTAIILKSTDYICVAADTKLVSIESVIKNQGRVQKIKLLNNFAYTNVGLFKDSKGIFDVDTIVKEASQKASSLREIHKIVVDEICKKLPIAILDIQQTNPVVHSRYIQNNHNKISIAFIGNEEDKLTIIASHIEGTDIQCTHEEIDTSSGQGLLILGSQSEINTYLDTHENPLKKGLESGLEFLINLEAKKNPEFVSLPIDILVIDSSGFRWIRNSN